METEPQLIYVNMLKDALRTDDGAKALGHSVHRLFCVDKIIDSLPTVDAVEVVHGHWNVLRFMTEPWQPSLPDKYVCSECKKITYSKHNYCPNCGAKMDLE